MDGFSRVEYTEASSVEELTHVVRDGRADFTQDTAPAVLPTLDGSRAITVLAGIHVGCYELFGGERVRTLSDLKGASIGLTFMGQPNRCSSPAFSPTWVWIRATT
jgi:NitT/TauT family transport system substrate-binding protein